MAEVRGPSAHLAQRDTGLSELPPPPTRRTQHAQLGEHTVAEQTTSRLTNTRGLQLSQAGPLPQPPTGQTEG